MPLFLIIFFLIFDSIHGQAHLYASFSPLPSDGITVEESQKDKARVNLAYSNSIYDNVGVLYACTGNESFFSNRSLQNGSVVYMGGKACLAAAHCHGGEVFSYKVGFEVSGKKVEYYKVAHFIKHPKYKERVCYDVAVLILEKKVEGLGGICPNYTFPKQGMYKDGKHLFTYVGYGAECFCNNWFEMSADGRRRAEQSYLYHCAMFSERSVPVILSTPYGYFNTVKADAYYNSTAPRRPLIPYEAKCSSGMSGGMMFHAEMGFVGIINGTRHQIFESGYVSVYLKLAYVINCIISVCEFFCPFVSMGHLNANITGYGACVRSFPLSACRDFIEEKRREFDSSDDFDV
jgi:hypothetical protein